MPIHMPPNTAGVRNKVMIAPNTIHWDAAGIDDPLDYLLAMVSIGGTNLHLEAVAVRGGDGVEDYATGVHYQSKLDDAYRLAGDDGGQFERAMIEGREYVLMMLPFQG